MSMENGILLKGIGSFYEVLTDHGTTVTCKARGLFRRQHLVPTVGDHVLWERQSQGYALLAEILPRKNILVRPPVANIDRIFLVVAASVPEPDWLLLDQMILQAKRLGIDPIPVLNKVDQADEAIVQRFHEDYRAFETLCVSAESKEGLDAMRCKMTGCVTCFAGQSAVGKSSLLNALFSELHLAVGAVSEKTEHGRHTTRHAELLPYENGAVLDTPGFSLFESELIEQADLNKLYPEFADAPYACRYPDCMHDSEPDCGVKELVASGGISKGRYERYLTIAREFQLRRKHRYD